MNASRTKAQSLLAAMAGLLATLLVALSMAGCASGGSTQPYDFQPPQDAGDADTTWTVLLYLCGSDLESQSGLATDNLIELLSCDLGQNVTFAVETGGTKRWQNNVVSPRYLERYVAKAGNLSQVAQMPVGNMAASDVLADFIRWGTAEYPSDRTMLVFWDHGGGTLGGVCADELYSTANDYDTLSLPELRSALEAAGEHFDIIGFDTCLMATLETAEVVAPYGDYLVASEEAEPGGGWAYNSWPAWLAQYPGIDPAELARGICDSYYYKCEQSWTDDMATLSVTDLSRIPALSQAFRDVSAQIALSTTNIDNWRLLAQGASRAENYGGNTSSEGWTDMVDLGDLMANTSSVLGESATAVSKALDDAVVYSVNGTNRSKAQGLSVFYPLATDANVFDLYAQITDNIAYLQYLAVLSGTYNSVDWENLGGTGREDIEPVSKEGIDISFTQKVNGDGQLELTVASGMQAITSVRFELGFYDIDDSVYYPLGTDNNLQGNWSTGIFTDLFQGTWMSIDGNFVHAELIEENDDYNLYTIPIMLNGERSNLRAAWVHDTGSWEVLGTYDGIDGETGMAGKSIRPLQDGDEVAFLFTATDIETGDGFEVDMYTLTWKDGMQMADEDLSDGLYLYRYQLIDVFGDVHYSDPVFMHLEDGRTWVEEI